MPDIVGLNRIFENKQLAIESFGTLDERQVSRYDDGKQVLARYYNEEGNVASLIGIYHYKRTDGGVDYGNVEVKDYSMNDVEYITTIIERVRDIEETIEANTERIDTLRARLVLCCGEPGPEPGPGPNYLTFTNVGERDNKIWFHVYNYAPQQVTFNPPVLYYSLDDGITWENWFDVSNPDTSQTEYDYTGIVLSPGQSVKMYGENQSAFFAEIAGANFSMDTTSPIACSGNIMTLISLDEPEDIPASNFFEGIFSDCSQLIQAPELPATGLTFSCYGGMFRGCSSLTDMPELPANTLAEYCYSNMFANCSSLTGLTSLNATEAPAGCYSQMFYKCTSLTQSPELPAVTVGGGSYSGMFRECSALVTPPELPATSISSSCYNSMFYQCTSLTSAPELPALQVFDNSYSYMFNRCTSLTTPPELPATTLDNQCYSYMFAYSGIETPPELPALQLESCCYQDMFLQCRSLQYTPELPSTQLASGCYAEMFRGCNLIGDAPDLPATNLEYNCYSSMFANCISLTGITELPATTLADSCYEGMFSGTNIATAPELPAQTLTNHCYYRMFYTCQNLSYVKCLAEGNIEFYMVYQWLTGVSSTGTFVKKTGVTYPQTPPNTWTIEEID